MEAGKHKQTNKKQNLERWGKLSKCRVTENKETVLHFSTRSVKSEVSLTGKTSVKKGLKNHPLKLNTGRLRLTLERTVLVDEQKQETDLIMINHESK